MSEKKSMKLIYYFIFLILFSPHSCIYLKKKKINYLDCGIKFICTDEVVIPLKFGFAVNFSEGLSLVSVNKKMELYK